MDGYRRVNDVKKPFCEVMPSAPPLNYMLPPPVMYQVGMFDR
jgi:hypothetical protein